MNSRAIVSLLALGLVGLTTGRVARSKPVPPSEKNLNDRESAGKHIFLQRCSLCHLATYSKAVDWSEPDASPPPIGPRLAGLLKEANPDQEKVVRGIIRKGTQKMPGFQYALEPKELEDLIAYMKTL